VWNGENFIVYYVHDGNKNVSEVVAHDRSLAAHYEYASFGTVTVSFGISAASNPWRFSSEFVEDDIATVYYNYRHYAPCFGRWLSRDLLESDHSLLETQFCHNSPNAIYDYLGRDWLSPPGPPEGGWNAPPSFVLGDVRINTKEDCCCKVCLYSAIDIRSSRSRGPLSIRGGMRGHTWITVEDCFSSNDQIVSSEHTFSFGPDCGHTDKEYFWGVPGGYWPIESYTDLTNFVVSKKCWEQGSSACKAIKDDINKSYPKEFSLSDYCTSTAVVFLRNHGIVPPSGIGEIEIPGPNVSRPNPRDMYQQIIESGGTDIKR
jgi:RHS repeat-associated protein